jgi:triacylglycerol esterase/lipase EstA (alpha/beta hydrolase family)
VDGQPYRAGVRRPLLFCTTVLLVFAVSGFAVAAAGTRAVVRPARDPVLLVHGFNGSGASWHTMTASLRAVGYHADEVDAMSYDSHESNVETAQRIAHEVQVLRQRTGAARVDVVSHSMGAIASRYYLERLGGTADVDAWVSLAGVNEGTVWAYGCYVLTPCREMVPTSSLLEGLNEAFRPDGTTRYATWWSPCDEAIVPHANAQLRGARNTETTCLGHSDIKRDPTVIAQVERFLAASSRVRT